MISGGATCDASHMGDEGAELQVRPADADDAAALAALCAQLGYPAGAEALAQRLASLADRDAHCVLVACVGGRVVGWLHAAVMRALEYPPCTEILGLVVDESQRGRGAGAALVAAAERWAHALGYVEMRVRSRDSRADAHRFYLREGYAEWKRQVAFRKPLR
jgi:GNAT superfamily N-acetyltransferase